jgi:uncharacterized membrane protein
MNTVTRNTLRAATVVAGAVAVVVAVRATRRRTVQWRDEGRPEERETRASVILPGAREDVYDLFRDLNRLATALGPTVAILVLDDTTFRWAHHAGGQPTVILTGHVTGDVPEFLLSWETADPPLPHEGSVRFALAGDGTQTRVDVDLRYRWSPDRARRAGIPDRAVDGVVSGYLRALQRSLLPGGAQS